MRDTYTAADKQPDILKITVSRSPHKTVPIHCAKKEYYPHYHHNHIFIITHKHHLPRHYATCGSYPGTSDATNLNTTKPSWRGDESGMRGSVYGRKQRSEKTYYGIKKRKEGAPNVSEQTRSSHVFYTKHRPSPNAPRKIQTQVRLLRGLLQPGDSAWEQVGVEGEGKCSWVGTGKKRQGK